MNKWLGILTVWFCGIVPTTTVLAEEAGMAENKEAVAVRYFQEIQKDSQNQDARRQLAGLMIDSQAEVSDEGSSNVLAALETHLVAPSYPTLYFPLSFLNNAALTAHDESMNQQVLLVLQKLQNNDNATAIKLSEALHQKYPNHPVPYNLLGLAWQGKGDPTKAHDFFEKALALKENFHAARLNLAELELYLGEFKAAHQELDTVLNKDDHNRRACLVKADLYMIEGQNELATRWYSKASESL